MTMSSRPVRDEVPHADVSRRVVEKLQRMTAEEAKASLVRSGIITPDGELTEPYRYDVEQARRHT